MEARDGVGSLLQLNANSTLETDYMYGKKPLELFKSEYKRHTPFDKQPWEMKNTRSIIQTNQRNNADFGDIVVFNIDTKIAEMMGHMCLCFRLPSITNYRWDNNEPFQWTNDLGYAMIETVKIINGDEELVSYSGNYLHIYSLLCVSKSKQNGISNMVGHYNTRHSLHGHAHTLYVPIPFMESREDRQYFPMFLSNAQTFQIIVKLKKIRDLIYIPNSQGVRCTLRVGPTSVSVQVRTKENIQVSAQLDARLMFDTFHLSYEERHLFQTRESHLLYQYIQERNFILDQDSTELSMLLDFAHSVSSLIVCVVPACAVDHNQHFHYEPLNRIKLILNGVVVNKSHHNHDKMSAEKYRYLQSFTNIPNKWIYVIPFCLSSDNTQPSGYFTFDSPNKKSTLMIERDTPGKLCTVYVYAITYNKLNIEQGTISSVL